MPNARIVEFRANANFHSNGIGLADDAVSPICNMRPPSLAVIFNRMTLDITANMKGMFSAHCSTVHINDDDSMSTGKLVKGAKNEYHK